MRDIVGQPIPSGFKLGVGLRLYVVGDIHGRSDLLDNVFRAIDHDLSARECTRHCYVFLGDYIDRGGDARGVIDRLIELGERSEVRCLRGNHEKIALDYLRNPAALMAWRSIGGFETLASYGVFCPLNPSASEQQRVAAEFHAAFPPRHMQFLAGLRPSFAIDDVFFAHAGVRPGVPLHAQAEMDLMWIRDEFLSHRQLHEKLVVHGHTPVRSPEIHPNRVNIDTGAYVTGKLTCLWMEGDRMGFL